MTEANPQKPAIIQWRQITLKYSVLKVYTHTLEAYNSHINRGRIIVFFINPGGPGSPLCQSMWDMK
jgi:hypothetical protein